MTTSEFLQALKGRLERTIEGPWVYKSDRRAVVTETTELAVANDVNYNDGQFIAQSRVDVPTLLGLLEYALYDLECVKSCDTCVNRPGYMCGTEYMTCGKRTDRKVCYQWRGYDVEIKGRWA